jgi:putative transposon-encoded protein
MINVNTTTAKKLILESGYEKVYTDEVKTNGGNSGKIGCKKEFIGREVVIFVLKNKWENRNGK